MYDSVLGIDKMRNNSIIIADADSRYRALKGLNNKVLGWYIWWFIGCSMGRSINGSRMSLFIVDVTVLGPTFLCEQHLDLLQGLPLGLRQQEVDED